MLCVVILCGQSQGQGWVLTVPPKAGPAWGQRQVEEVGPWEMQTQRWFFGDKPGDTSLPGSQPLLCLGAVRHFCLPMRPAAVLPDPSPGLTPAGLCPQAALDPGVRPLLGFSSGSPPTPSVPTRGRLQPGKDVAIGWVSESGPVLEGQTYGGLCDPCPCPTGATLRPRGQEEWGDPYLRVGSPWGRRQGMGPAEASRGG